MQTAKTPNQQPVNLSQEKLPHRAFATPPLRNTQEQLTYLKKQPVRHMNGAILQSEAFRVS